MKLRTSSIAAAALLVLGSLGWSWAVGHSAALDQLTGGTEMGSALAGSGASVPVVPAPDMGDDDKYYKGNSDLPANIRAFLDTIAYAELHGCGEKVDSGSKGYNIRSGCKPMLSLKSHPGRKILKGGMSTAAGRYQIIWKTWSLYKGQLGLSDFSPASQDRIAVQLIKEKKAYDMLLKVSKNTFPAVIKKLSSIWAPFPGNNYGQSKVKTSLLWAEFQKARAKY